MTALRGEWKHKFSMARLSSWRVGGPADDLFLPADLDDLRAFYESDSRARTAFIVGHGSNLLVRDGGIRGVVVRVAPVCRPCEWKKTDAYMPKPGRVVRNSRDLRRTPDLSGRHFWRVYRVPSAVPPQ